MGDTVALKVSNYLQKHVSGEVTTAKDVRKYFSTDGSVFELEPAIVVYPRTTADVRKTARFVWQLAERGKFVPITARGSGTDQSGGSLGEGIMIVFPAHMKKLLELDTGKKTITIQPGLNFRDMQNTLLTHGLHMPVFPSSIDYCSIGGAVANNCAGEKSIKYGNIVNFVEELEVVLANGELITTKKLSKSALNKKKGLNTLEGEIYRNLDNLLTDNKSVINSLKLNVSKNTAGYNLASVKDSKGGFDLTPLIVGSQGTLGVVTQVKLKTVPHNPVSTLIVAFFDGIHEAAKATTQLRKLDPNAIEMVDDNLLNFIDKNNPGQLNSILKKPFPAIVLLIEFDDLAKRTQKSKVKKATKICKEFAYDFTKTEDAIEKEMLWQLRHSAAAVVSHSEGNVKALPIIEDGVVPHSKFEQYVHAIYDIFDKYNLDIAVWGHAGNANLHMQPFLDLSRLADRQKVFKIMDDYYNTVIDMGGSTAGEHNDGRLRAPYLPKLYGGKMYRLFQDVKAIFDPYNIMNPGVKIDVLRKDVKPLLRKEYSMGHLGDHMPRT